MPRSENLPLDASCLTKGLSWISGAMVVAVEYCRWFAHRFSQPMTAQICALGSHEVELDSAALN